MSMERMFAIKTDQFSRGQPFRFMSSQQPYVQTSPTFVNSIA